MRLHLLSLPHTQTTDEYLTCAYTQKVVKFCRMMHPQHEVILYSGEHNDAPCAEHVPCMSEAKRAKWFGRGFDTVLTPLRWDTAEPYWKLFNKNCAREVLKRAEERDLLLIIAGNCQVPVVDAVRSITPLCALEWGIGYEGVALPYRAFESYAWMHHVYGLQRIVNGAWYDAVIPNFFDPTEFAVSEKDSDDYLLFMGRVVARKGPHVALQIAERAGLKLVVAGPGAETVAPGKVIAPEVTLEGNVEYVGEVGVEERKRLMAGARALLAPTLYIEPFGGVVVEAMLSGTPAITTDWGAFTETVEPGITGFRFHTVAEGVAAVEAAPMLSPERIRERALERYSLEAVRPQFERFFQQVLGLWGPGWAA